MANKLLGRLEEKPNNFGGTEIRIGFTKDDIEYLQANLNDKGWVNVTLKTSKAGKPYIDHWDGQKGGGYVAPAPVQSDADGDLPF